MTTTVRALVADGAGRIDLDDVAMPSREDWVLVRAEVSGICGTDLHIADGLLPGATSPIVLGHEGAGTVAHAPTGSGLDIGDRVALLSTVPCGGCLVCRTGHGHCTSPVGQLGFTLPGTFSDFWQAPAANLITLPESVSFEDGALLGCAGITAVRAVRAAQVEPADLVVVNGIGGVGLAVIQAAVAHGCRVIAIADSADKAGLASDAGAFQAVVGPAATAESIDECAGGDSIAAFFDLVCTPASANAAMDTLAAGGRYLVLTSSGQPLEIDPGLVLSKELRLVGSLAGTRDDFELALRLTLQGDMRAQVDRRYPLVAAMAGLERVRQRQAVGRNLIVW